MNLLLSIHVAAGGLAIILGAVALIVKKGGTQKQVPGDWRRLEKDWRKGRSREAVFS